MKMGTMAVALLSAGAAACASTGADAGEWRFHPERCPDLVEDHRDRRESRRDERYDRGPYDRLEDRLDRRENRRDERVTLCPASAWVWHGAGGHFRRPARPAAVAVYYDHDKRHYYRIGPDRRVVVVTVR